MMRKLYFMLAVMCTAMPAFADITGIGSVIVTPSLVSVTNNGSGTARVVIDLFAKSDSSNLAALTSYNFSFTMGGAPGVNVSATSTGGFFNATNFDGGTGGGFIGAASGTFASGSYTFKGERDNPALPLAITNELVGRAIFDVTQQSSASSYTIATTTLASQNNFATNNVSGGSFTLNIDGFTGGGGGGGGGGGAAVPEPSSVAAISLVLGAVGFRTLRRRRQGKA